MGLWYKSFLHALSSTPTILHRNGGFKHHFIPGSKALGFLDLALALALGFGSGSGSNSGSISLALNLVLALGSRSGSSALAMSCGSLLWLL